MAELKRGNERQVKEEQEKRRKAEEEKRKAELKRENERRAKEKQDKGRQVEEEKREAEIKRENERREKEEQKNQLDEEKAHLLRKIADLESEIRETERLGFDVESSEGLETNNDTNKSKHIHSFPFALFSFVLVITLSVTAHYRFGLRSKVAQGEYLLK